MWKGQSDKVQTKYWNFLGCSVLEEKKLWTLFKKVFNKFFENLIKNFLQQIKKELIFGVLSVVCIIPYGPYVGACQTGRAGWLSASHCKYPFLTKKKQLSSTGDEKTLKS